MGPINIGCHWLHYAAKDWLCTLVIGAMVTSWWRGFWVLLDIWTCNQPPSASLAGGDSFCFLVPAMEDGPDGYYWNMRLQGAKVSYGIGLALLFVGISLLWSGAWLPRLTALSDGTAIPGKVTPSLAIFRLITVYILGTSAVNLWRSIWYWADAWIFPGNPLASYWTTSLVGSTVAFLFNAGASLLAPPAIFLLDGPGESPPPIGVTVLSSYYSVACECHKKLPALPLYVRIIDVIGSFVMLPFFVVFYWRGTWLLFDHYFWGFTTDSQDIHFSKLWGTIFFLICILVTSEPAIAILDRKIRNQCILGMFGRLRTYILAWGTVSYWRIIWYVWDEFSGCSEASAWSSHIVAMVVLLSLGCFASVNAPASTMGVDSVPHPKCADEPMFSMLPIPYEVLYFFAIGRQEWVRKEQAVHVSIDVDASTRDEARAGAQIETELTPIEDTKFDTCKVEEERPSEAPHAEPERSERPGLVLQKIQSVRSWRLGPNGETVNYHELQRPQLSSRTKSEYAMRPGEDNIRNRTRLFRSR